MNITERAAKVLQEIDARLTDSACGPDEAGALRCLKTAIEGLLPIALSETCADDAFACNHPSDASDAITTLCDQWEASRK